MSTDNHLHASSDADVIFSDEPSLPIREDALTRIAGALESIARTMELDYQARFPPKKVPRDVEITYIPTEEEERRLDLGETGEATTADWTSLGPREQAFAAKEKAAAERRTGPNGTGKVRG